MSGCQRVWRRKAKAFPRHISTILVAVGLLMAGVSPNARAQLAPPVPLPKFDPTGRSGEPPPLQKEQPLEPQPGPVIPTPALPSAEEREGRLPAIRVFVREVRIVGNTVFTDEELAQLTAPYINRELTTEDLESVRLALTLHYVKHGYVTSGAVVPDQPVLDGVITIHVIEGRLSRIDIEGAEYFRPSYLHKRIALAAGPPVQITTLQERLLLLQQDQRIQRINAELRPGVVRGESELRVKVEEASPYKASVAFNNYQTPTVGAERGLGTVSHQNLTGNGDIFSFTYGLSEGLILLVDTFYTLPLTAHDTSLTGSYRRNNFEVVESPFEALNLETQSEIIGLTLRQPLYQTLNNDVSLAITGDYLYNQITFAPFGLPEVPFNPPGFQNGVANVRALRFIPQWIYRDRQSVLAIRSRFSIGLDVLDATINSGPVPDGQFFAWLGQVQAVRRLDRWWGLQILGRFDMQLADDRLFPLEQYPVGGRFTVRGYRENTFVRDNAIVASAEVRVPVIRTRLGREIVQVAPFLDYGSSWNTGDTPNALRRGFIASAGLGLRWNILPQNRARFELYWGAQLNHIDQGTDDLQDHGIHLQAVVEFF